MPVQIVKIDGVTYLVAPEDNPKDPCCMSVQPGSNWRCTLDPGHDGPDHISTGPDDSPGGIKGHFPIYARWPV